MKIFFPCAADKEIVSRRLEDDKKRRRVLREQQELTGQILGDPPPGYSALDKKVRKPNGRSRT